VNTTDTTIAQVLADATAQLRDASETPRLDAELLLAHALGWGRARVLAERAARLTPAQQRAFRALVARRAAREPVAYLTGHREFFGLEFIVTPEVLVPRPETELLVERALALAGRWTKDKGRRLPFPHGAVPPAQTADIRRSSLAVRRLTIVDVGTGSGCIAVALAAHLPDAAVYAVDIAPAALAVAARNAARHGVAERVRLLQGDLLAPLPEPVDLLVSNPPYTVLSEIAEGVRRYEPRPALDGGPDGLAVYRRLLAAAPAALRPGGAALLEIGATQAAAVVTLARAAFPQAAVQVYKDLAGLDRVVEIVTQYM
jgi:release factor glutamine methyltransferase